MIIQFFPHHTVDAGSFFEILEYAVNAEGFMVQKESARGNIAFALPSDEAFTPNQPKLVGISQFANRTKDRTGKMLYTFAEITPELVAGLIFGPISNQHYTTITDELGIRSCWSRGIKNIYFV